MILRGLEATLPCSADASLFLRASTPPTIMWNLDGPRTTQSSTLNEAVRAMSNVLSA